MTDLHDLVYDWAVRYCPALLDDERLFQALVLFLFETIDFSILAARRQLLREFQEPKHN